MYLQILTITYIFELFLEESGNVLLLLIVHLRYVINKFKKMHSYEK